MTVVIDASVAAKWYFAEDGREAAAGLRDRNDLTAPGILRVELLGVVTKRHRRREIDDRTGDEIVWLLPSMPVRFVPDEALLEQAYRASIGSRIGFQDALYVACALRFDAPLISGDERLLRALRAMPTSVRAYSLQQIDALPAAGPSA